LSKAELLAGFSLRMDRKKAIKMVEEVFAQMDTNKSGTIDYTGTHSFIYHRICACHDG
jgi:hypothetical protein